MPQVKLSDFTILEELGAGSFGIVKLVEKDGLKYALKELSKQKVIDVNKSSLLTSFQTGKTENVFRERDFLKMFNHHAFPKIHQTF